MVDKKEVIEALRWGAEMWDKKAIKIEIENVKTIERT